MDRAGMLSPQTIDRLEGILRAVRDQGGSQLQVLTVANLEGTPIEQAALRVAETWRLGTAKEDNGILLLIAAQERAIRIEVGQGREGELPDVIAKRIISDVMVPAMKRGSADQAVFTGVLNILKYSDPEILQKIGEKVPRAERRQKSDMSPLTFLILVIIVGLFQILAGRRRFHGGGFGRGGWGGGGFGGGGFGGGGGWGGGGGGFSGGGASGNW